MKRILAILIIIGLGCLVVYAFVPGVKANVDKTLGPPLGKWFGGIVRSITTSPFWLNWIVPWPNQLIIGLVVGVFPVAWLIHRGFNKARGYFVKSAYSESPVQPIMTVPSQVTPPTATTRTTTPTPAPATPAPTPQPTTATRCS